MTVADEVDEEPAGAPEVPSAAEAEELVYLPDYRPPVRDVRLGVDGSLWVA